MLGHLPQITQLRSRGPGPGIQACPAPKSVFFAVTLCCFLYDKLLRIIKTRPFPRCAPSPLPSPRDAFSLFRKPRHSLLSSPLHHHLEDVDGGRDRAPCILETLLQCPLRGCLTPACTQLCPLPRCRGRAGRCGSSSGPSTKLEMAVFTTLSIAGAGVIGKCEPRADDTARCVSTGHQEYYTSPAKACSHPRLARNGQFQLPLCAMSWAAAQELSVSRRCPLRGRSRRCHAHLQRPEAAAKGL